MTDLEVKEYEFQLREAQRKAEIARDEKDKAAWLRIAQEWLRMLMTQRHTETVQPDPPGWPAPTDKDSQSSH